MRYPKILIREIDYQSVCGFEGDLEWMIVVDLKFQTPLVELDYFPLQFYQIFVLAKSWFHVYLKNRLQNARFVLLL